MIHSILQLSRKSMWRRHTFCIRMWHSKRLRQCIRSIANKAFTGSLKNIWMSIIRHMSVENMRSDMKSKQQRGKTYKHLRNSSKRINSCKLVQVQNASIIYGKRSTSQANMRSECSWKCYEILRRSTKSTSSETTKSFRRTMKRTSQTSLAKKRNRASHSWDTVVVWTLLNCLISKMTVRLMSCSWCKLRVVRRSLRRMSMKYHRCLLLGLRWKGYL